MTIENLNNGLPSLNLDPAELEAAENEGRDAPQKGYIFSDCDGTTAQTQCSCCECCDAADPTGCSLEDTVEIYEIWEHDMARPDNTFDFVMSPNDSLDV